MSPFGRAGVPDRVARAAWWLLPLVFLFWLYRAAFSTWFMADDFAWLSLLHRVQVRHDLFHELFAPMAQGTIRPWSERSFFLVLHALFGLDSLPFRIVVFSTASADVLLVAWITLRSTGSRVAGFVAPVLWIANSALVRAMTWSSAYNEIMCPLFLLSALALFIRYAETGRRSLWWWQLVVFSLGFGALETNVVYPAIAAAWAIFAAPGVPPPANGKTPLRLETAHLLRGIAPLAIVSTAYFALHRLAAPLPQSGAYSLHFDSSLFKTAALYLKWSIAPEAMERFGYSPHAALVVFLLGSIALTSFVTTEILRHRFAVLFYLAWFAVTLAPMLPLSEHRTDYYLTIPVIGFAMLGGAAAGRYWNAPVVQRSLMIIPIAAYLWAMISVTSALTAWWRERSLPVRTLVLGVIAAKASHPGKAIAVEGVTPDLHELSFDHLPFAGLGIDDVYLTPGSELMIRPTGPNADLRELVLEPDALSHGVTHDDVVVYSLGSDHLRNITEGYRRRLVGRPLDRLPGRIDVGNSLYSWLLGPTWLPPESGIRWMPGSATVRIGVPKAGCQLELEGRIPGPQLLAAPRHLMVLVDGVVAGDTRIYGPETTFRRLFQMPDMPAGKIEAEIEIRVDPVDRKDGQDYGAVFGEIAICP